MLVSIPRHKDRPPPRVKIGSKNDFGIVLTRHSAMRSRRHWVQSRIHRTPISCCDRPRLPCRDIVPWVLFLRRQFEVPRPSSFVVVAPVVGCCSGCCSGCSGSCCCLGICLDSSVCHCACCVERFGYCCGGHVPPRLLICQIVT
jgi:hypothetical protein